MRVVVLGGTGMLGRAAVPCLVEAGHDVVVACRRRSNHEQAAALGASAAAADLRDRGSLTSLFAGADAVVNLATRVPVGHAGVWPGAWRAHDRLLESGVAAVVEAARDAGVRRVVQQSLSSLYADQGDEWITERSPLEILAVTEPNAVAATHVQQYTCDSRTGVILRFGQVIGDDPLTRHWLRAAAHGRPVGIGRPDQWAHVVHTDDIGPAVLASLVAPAGCYNVGAAAVQKSAIVDAYAEAVDTAEVAFMGPLLRRLAGPRIEPLARSLRVCSEHFSAQTGWRPTRSDFGTDWLLPAARSARGDRISA